MSRARWFVSALILYHLIAVAFHQLPDPRSLNPAVEIRTDSAGRPFLSRVLTPLLDSVATAIYSLEPRAYALTAPLRALTQPYVSAGLRQYWAMFANPEFRRNYVRLDYHIATGLGPERIERELVFPAGREDRARVIPDFLEKAGFTAIEGFHYPDAADLSGQPKGNELVPMIRYFRTRFAARNLGNGERVVRTDFWYGFAPIAPPAQNASSADRLRILAGYYAGPQPLSGSSQSARERQEEREGEILWRLEFVDTP